MKSVETDEIADDKKDGDNNSCASSDGAVDVIGFGLSVDDLTEKHKKIIEQAEVLVGGRRHLDCFNNLSCEKVAITKDIHGVIARIRERLGQGRRVVVVASGDPLFHGIGTTLINALGRSSVNIYPNISSVAAAFAAIKEPWHNAELVTLHGKDREIDFVKLHDRALLKKDRCIAILTDHLRTPAWLAQHLISKNIYDFRMYVFENLGSVGEKISSYDDLATAAEKRFDSPNIVILKPIEPDCHTTVEAGKIGIDRAQGISMKSYPGMEDHLFTHEKGLITKSEIRAVVLSKLQLISDGHIFWDLGAGSGSVSIEVSRFIPRGRIFAVEKNGTRVMDIRDNVAKFGISNMEVVHGELPDVMSHLPDPDRVFIGGGGADIATIINRAGERLAADGIMVINTVLLQTMDIAMKSLKEMGFHVKLIQVQVSAAKEMPFGERLDPLNPVWIISGKKTWSSKAGLKI